MTVPERGGKRMCRPVVCWLYNRGFELEAKIEASNNDVRTIPRLEEVLGEVPNQWGPKEPIFFLLRTAPKGRPQGPPTANRQPPPTANHQPPPTTTNRQLPIATNRQPPTANRHQLWLKI